MSGIHGQVLGHLVRRGYEALTTPDNRVIESLREDATLYDQAGPEMDVQPWEMLPVVVTAFLTMILVACVKYTIGEVMASLAMIESRTTTAFVGDSPPAYADVPDAPLEKEPLMPSEAEADLEVTLVNDKPITRKIRTTITHLHQVGGFGARFRGASVSVLYHFLHALVTNSLAGILGMGILGNAFVYVWVSVGLARVHMIWTHAMIGTPSSKPFWKRMVPRQQSKAILLPSFVFAVAQQATFLLPVAVAFALGLPEINQEHVVSAAHNHDCHKLAFMGLRFLAVPATAIFVALAVLLPATVTLTRIEALLLPEDRDTIVPFDRKALIGDIDINACGGCRALFVQAWRSFDSTARWSLIKLYVKMTMIQVGIIFVSVHLMVAEIYIVGGDRLALLFKSAAAQMQLAAFEAQTPN
jgi:hypothetical protein